MRIITFFLKKIIVSDFNQMASNTSEIELPESEYTDLLNVSVTDKKRKICADISGNNGNNIRIKKETGKCI